MNAYLVRGHDHAEAAGWSWRTHRSEFPLTRAPAWLRSAALGAAVLGTLELARPAAAVSPTLRASVEGVLLLSAVAIAWMLRAQFIHARRRRDLLLLAALLMLALVDFSSFALPSALGPRAADALAAAPTLGNALVALIFLKASFTSRERLVEPRGRPLIWTVSLSIAAFAATELAALAIPVWLVNAGAGNAHGVSGAAGHPLTLLVALGGAGVLLLSAVRFARGDAGRPWGVGSLLAGALLLAAAARLNDLALPWPAPEWVAPRDGLRLVVVGFLFLAVARGEREMRLQREREAAMTERRRIARDLHDGLAQDLAFIAAHGEQLARSCGTEHPIAVAAKRALAASRGAIVDLSAREEPTTFAALRAVGAELAERFDLTVRVDVAPTIQLGEADREDVVRIVREAIVNAARHGGAQDVAVSLGIERDGRCVLRIRDDGRGIAAHRTGAAGSRFGLASMRERAAALGGRLSLGEAPEGGVDLEVVLR